MRLLFLLPILCLLSCTSPTRQHVPLSCALMPEAGMDTMAFKEELKRIRELGFQEIRLDLPLIRSAQGLPLADTALLKLLPGLVQACQEKFPYWSVAITRLHPDSIADSVSLRLAGKDLWCQQYIQEAERYLALLPAKPRHLIAGWHLPETDTFPCLEVWMKTLRTRAENVCWLLPPERLPHRLHQAGTETGILWTLPGDQASKPASRKMTQAILKEINSSQTIYIGSFSPRPGQAEADFRNIFRFWPETVSLSGVTFASVFPVSTLTDSLIPGNLHEEIALKQEIRHYLQQP